MSNYTKTTDFEAKDSLPSGDSGKIIRGSEFETEFDNIATAIATKADAASPTFTGTVTIDGLTVNGNTTLGNAATDTVTVTADIASNLIPSADDTYNLGASGAEWNDLYVDGTAYIDAINFNGTAITATAAELNIMDGVTATTAELNIMDGVTATTAELNYVDGVTSAIQTQLDSKANLSGANFTGAIDVTGTVTADGLTVEKSASRHLFLDLDSRGDSNGALICRDGVSNNLRNLDVEGQEIQLATNTFSNSTSVPRLKISSGGDFSLYEDTGTTAKLFWDASAERLGIGNSSPTTALDVTGTIKGEGLQASAANPGVSLFESDTTDLNAHLNSNFGSFRIATISDVGGSYTQRINVDHATGDIRFYENTGSTAKFHWDASAEQLKLGTIEGAAGGSIVAKTDSNGYALAIEENSGTERWSVGVDVDGDLGFFNSTDSTASVTFDDSGNVGIGTSSPDTELSLSLASTTTTTLGQKGGIQLKSDSSTIGNGGEITWQAGTGNSERWCAISGHIVSNDGTGARGDLVFATKDATSDTALTEAMRIDSSGHLIVPEGITLGTSAGTYAAANTLDDYEEGSFTPAFSGGDYSFTYHTQKGSYTKIGNRVFVEMLLYIDTSTAPSGSTDGDLNVTGLPFNFDAQNSVNVLGAQIGFKQQIVNAEDSLSVRFLSGSSSFTIIKDLSTGFPDGSLLQASDLVANSRLRIQFSYPTNS